jgi:aspartate/methionine/tyrosine aminotransferase
MFDSDEYNCLAYKIFSPNAKLFYLPFVIAANAEIRKARGSVSFLPSGAKTSIGEGFKATVRAKVEWLHWVRQPADVIVHSLCERYRQRRRVPAERRIFPSQGASAALTAVAHAIAKKSRGGHILQPDWEYPVIREFAEERQIPVVTCPHDQLASHITRDTILVYISADNNPTGRPVSRHTLDEIFDAAQKASRPWIALDRAFGDQEQGMLLAKNREYEQLLEVITFAKLYGLTTLKCAFTIASDSIVEAIEQSYQQLVGELCVDPCIDALFALDQLGELRAAAVEKIRDTKPFVDQGLGELASEGLIADVEPNSVGISFPRIVDCTDTYTFCRHAYARHRLALTPGTYFGDSSRVRLGWASLGVEEITDGIARFREALIAFRSQASRS